VPQSPVPGEARLDPVAASKIVMVRNVALGTLTNEQHLDAMIDTGATHCIVPPSVARVLGFHSGKPIRREMVKVVGGQVEMDMYLLGYLKVGSAKAYRVVFGVYNAVPGFRYILVGLSFIKQFRTTLDFDGNRILFRSRQANRAR
jgi:predicted aspartyl protease